MGRVTGADSSQTFRAVAAALAMVSTVSGCRPPATSATVDPGRLTASSPAGSTSVLEFTWDGPRTSARHRLVIRDASGAVVFSGETTEQSMNIDATARSRFATMVDYSWTVSAIDSAGMVTAESPPRSFTYQP